MRGTVECLDAVTRYVDLVRTRTGIMLPYPRVTFCLRGGVSGRAWAHKNLIEFNPILLDENPDVFVRQTVGHEVAHLATFVKYGRVNPHGHEWASVMRQIGLPPNRCHNYDTSVSTGRVGKSICREVLD